MSDGGSGARGQHLRLVDLPPRQTSVDALIEGARALDKLGRRGLHHRRGRDRQVGRRAERAGSCAERAGRRALVATGYSSIIFPFREIEVPVFDVEAM